MTSSYTKTDGTEVTRFSCAETAKLVRRALKQAFPTTKFSVRSKTYSGGASIDVRWTDGPTAKRVDEVVKLYEGASFDGMIDLKSYHDSILVDEHGEPRIVRFGADYVFTHRETSKATEKKLEAEVVEYLEGLGYTDVDTSWRGDYEVDTDYRGYGDARGVGLAKGGVHSGSVQNLAWRLFCFRDFEKRCRHEEYGTYPMGTGMNRCRNCGMRTRRAIEK